MRGPGGGVGYVSPSRCWEVTGRGARPSGPRRKSIEWGRASRGRWALFFEGGLGWSHGRGRRLPALLRERTLWSGVWRLNEGVLRAAGSLAAAGLSSGGEHIILRQARRCLYARRSSRGGRQASTARMSIGVHAKQFVVHLRILCQKAESFRVMWAVGLKVSAP